MRDGSSTESRPAGCPGQSPSAGDPAPGLGGRAVGRPDRRRVRCELAGHLSEPPGSPGSGPGHRAPGRYQPALPRRSEGAAAARGLSATNVDAGHRPAGRAGRGRGAEKIEDLIQREPAVEVERQIAATPDTVFSYLTDPDKFVAWMGTGAKLDPRPGGRFRIEVESGGAAVGEYREVDPPHRLVFSWGWEGDDAVPPGTTTVEITVTPARSGSLLRLRHLGLPSDA